MMDTSTGIELSAECAILLRGFGLEGEDLDGPLAADGIITPEEIADGTSPDSPAEMYDSLQETLARSARGIESQLRYWNRAPAYQLSDVLAPLGYEVEFPDEPGSDESFGVVLTGDDRRRRMTFSYPDTEYGDDNYPALVDAVERRLLPDDELTFVLLDRDDAWWFVLVERERLETLRERFGRRIRAFDRPLLAERQPSDFAAAKSPSERLSAGIGDPTDEGVVVESGIDDAFERVEREAATQPVRPDSSGEDIDEEVRALIGTGDAPTVTDVSDATLEDLVEKDADDRLVFDASGPAPAASEDPTLELDLDADDPDRSQPPDRRGADRQCGLSEQVAETLFPDDEKWGQSPDDDEKRERARDDERRDRSRGEGDTPVYTAADPATGDGADASGSPDAADRAPDPSGDAGPADAADGGPDRSDEVDDDADRPSSIRRITDSIRRLL